ncbi:MAG: hypothetical protein HUU16_20985 [Candidatus Omnitrophica bacterium]|nr:hypothetical protein [Candidatus Omnitrophota bacterium]
MSKPLSVAKFFPFALLTLSLPVQVLWAAVPDTITIQGTLEAPGGGPLTGTYSCAVRIWDASVGGSLLANMLNPMVLSDSGRFTLELSLGDLFVPPAQAWYDLGVDTDHNGIEEAEFFPHRVRFHSVPFARAAANSELLGGLPASAFVQSGSGGEGWSLAGNAAVAGDFSSSSPQATATRVASTSSVEIAVGRIPGRLAQRLGPAVGAAGRAKLARLLGSSP